ncbi:MAG: NUMOD1 domain-containing DNA-binding protein [Cetobacterium sp.]|nr:NUMOD1 domain-containing DNA-binding protein [Cetobacterium sp.]
MARSLTFYSFNDDLTIRNYMALTACILNPKLTQSRAIRMFSLNCEADKRNRLYSEKRSKYKFDNKPKKQEIIKIKLCLDIDKVNKLNVLDIKTNTYCEFDNIKSLEKTLGINKKQVKKYLESEELFLDQYKFIMG